MSSSQSPPPTGASAPSASAVPLPTSASPAPFLLKTYDIVDDPNTDAVVSWSPSGDSFVVWDAQHFCQHLLPRHFKHSNFSSFIRQLNIYGFSKSDPDRWEFRNTGFVRGQHHLLRSIRRRSSVIPGSRKVKGGTSSSSSLWPRNYPSDFRSDKYLAYGAAVPQFATQIQTPLSLHGATAPPSDIYTKDVCNLRLGQSDPEQVDMLKRQKTILSAEVMRLRQELRSVELSMQSMWQLLQDKEEQQHYMLALIAQATSENRQTVLERILRRQPQKMDRPCEYQVGLQSLNVGHPSSIAKVDRRRMQHTLPSIEDTCSISRRHFSPSNEGTFMLTLHEETTSLASDDPASSLSLRNMPSSSYSSDVQNSFVNAEEAGFPTHGECWIDESDQFHPDRQYSQYDCDSAKQWQSLQMREMTIELPLARNKHKALVISECGDTEDVNVGRSETESISSAKEPLVETVNYQDGHVQPTFLDEKMFANDV